MAELAPQERLQPSLLDRLTDDDPTKKQEARDKRVLSLQRLREVVLRDLSWLMNSCHLAAVQDLYEFPFVAESVLNYGIPDLTGRTAASVDAAALERVVRQAIWDFEPRIVRQTLRVRLVHDTEVMSHNALTFEIEGDLWAQPMPVRIFLKTEFDLEIGEVTVLDESGQVTG